MIFPDNEKALRAAGGDVVGRNPVGVNVFLSRLD